MRRAVIFDMYETLITHFACPLYFSEQMAADAGVPSPTFQALWRATEDDRTLGRVTEDDALAGVLRSCGCYSDALLRRIMDRRVGVKEDCFRHLHPQIVPMLRAIRQDGLRVGLISNCYSDEAEVIRRSELFPYFDAVCLSCELHLKKPDPALYARCTAMLDVAAADCLYVGDGGSRELEAAADCGMQPVQALWYLNDSFSQPCRRLPQFTAAAAPMEVAAMALR